MNTFNITNLTNEVRFDSKISLCEKFHHITGSVIERSGRAMLGVCVKIVSSNFDPISHTITQENGTFTLLTSFCKDFMLIFSKEGYSTLVVTDFPNSSTVALTKLIPTAFILGKIVFHDDSPISSARIRLTNDNYTFSSVDGCFVLTNVPYGHYKIIIDGNECTKTIISVCVHRNILCYDLGTIRIKRINILGTIHGITKDCDALPALNVIVMLHNGNTNAVVSHTFTDSNGLYFFGNVEIGNYYIKAYSD